MYITLSLNKLHSKIRTQLPESKYTGYWSLVATELEQLLKYDEETEGFSEVQVRFKNGAFEFKVDELEIEELPTYLDSESHMVNLGLYLWKIFEDSDIENVNELINPHRDSVSGSLAELENEYVDR